KTPAPATIPRPADTEARGPYENGERNSGMDYGKGTVFVLGAGFTKAFLPNAPLLEDDYGGDSLLEEFKGDGFRYARIILEEEMKLCGGGRINVERLMTRLSGGMPYDVEHRAREQLDLLLAAVTGRFVDRIADARASGDVGQPELRAFADHVI